MPATRSTLGDERGRRLKVKIAHPPYLSILPLNLSYFLWPNHAEHLLAQHPADAVVDGLGHDRRGRC